MANNPNHPVGNLVGYSWHLTAIFPKLDLASALRQPPNPRKGGDLCLSQQQRGNFAQHWRITQSDVAGYYWLRLGNANNNLGRLDVFAGNQNPGNNGRVCHALDNATQAQKWHIWPVPGQPPGYYHLTAQVSDMNLAIRSNNGVWEIVQVNPNDPNNDSRYQVWLIN